MKKCDAESLARRDTPLERLKSDLLALRNDEALSSRELQKMNTLSRQNTDQPPSSTTRSNQTSASSVAEKVARIVGTGQDSLVTDDGANSVTGAEAKEMSLEKPGSGRRRATSDASGSIWFEGWKKTIFRALRKMF